jgi:hypothetical protein
MSKNNLDKILQDAKQVISDCPDLEDCVRSEECNLYNDWTNCGFYKFQLEHNPKKGMELAQKYIDASRSEVCISQQPCTSGKVYCRDSIEINEGVICIYRSLFEDKEKGLHRCLYDRK